MRRFLQTLVLYNTDDDYVPRLLRQSATVGLWMLVFLSFLTANLQALFWQSSTWLVANVLPAIVVERTNDERLAQATVPLLRSARLDEAATRKAEHMASEGYFAHFSPEGISPWYWFEEVGYVYAHAGENLAVHFSDSGEVVKAWMDSPSHRANIVNANYREIGVGTARGVYEGFDTVFVVQLFGTPARAGELSDPVPVRTTEGEVPPAAVAITSDSVLSATTSVTRTATATPVALAYESTPREGDGESATPLPQLVPEKAVHDVVSDANDGSGVLISSGLMATSSGLPMAFIASPASAGATDTAVMARVATQPNLLLGSLYVALSVVIGGMLLLSLTLTARSHRWFQMAQSVTLLMLMGGLVQLHRYLTAGAWVG
jgi:hypothetical protein